MLSRHDTTASNNQANCHLDAVTDSIDQLIKKIYPDARPSTFANLGRLNLSAMNLISSQTPSTLRDIAKITHETEDIVAEKCIARSQEHLNQRDFRDISYHRIEGFEPGALITELEQHLISKFPEHKLSKDGAIGLILTEKSHSEEKILFNISIIGNELVITVHQLKH